jgi:folate-binding protein YgfZ
MPSLSEQYQALKKNAGWIELKEEIYELSGKHHLNFLNAYNTQNIQTISPNSIVPGAFLTQKGKLVSSTQIIRLSDKILLLFEPGFAKKVLEHLQVYLTFAEAHLTEVTSQFFHIGIFGAKAKSILQKLYPLEYGESPSPVQGEGEITFFPTSRFGIDGFDLFIPLEKKKETIERIIKLENEGEMLSLDPLVLETLRIEAKIPKMGVDMTEDNLVAEVGLDQTATSFNKGCYLGQETTARVQSRGHVNRKVFQFSLPQSYQENLPADIFQSVKKVGTLTSTVESIKFGGYIGMGLLHLQALERQEPLLVNSSEGKIEIKIP